MTSPVDELAQLLGRWANFRLIPSHAAATLIGLLFVVITLAAERRVGEAEPAAKIRVYFTPAVVCFTSVLGVGVLLIFLNHTRLTAALCICLVGVLGLVYAVSILLARDKKSYEERGDLLHYAGYPFAAYGLLVLGGVLVLHDAPRGLTLVALVCCGCLRLVSVTRGPSPSGSSPPILANVSGGVMAGLSKAWLRKEWSARRLKRRTTCRHRR